MKTINLKFCGKVIFFNRIIQIVFFVVACKGCTPKCDNCNNAIDGKTFFPLEVGRYIEYDVYEEEFNLGRPKSTQQYQIKELIAEKYQDPSGREAYRIERYRRGVEGQRWQPDSTITVRLLADQAIRNENGNEYVKMVFPPTEKLVWNGNIYNSVGEDNYELKNVGKDFKVGQQSFAQTATVIQQNDSTLVNQDKRLEVYAVGVGLVYRERINLQFCSSSAACVGKAQIDFGNRQYIKYKNAGKE